MQNYLKKYIAGLGFFLLVLFIATTVSQISYFDIGKQSASVIDILPTDAEPASGFAWSDSVGWINFGTSTEEVEGRVYVSNNKLYGYAWGENVGWISLNCENDNSCGDSNYGVTQTSSNGVLTGFAWGENIGWIDFAPDGGGVFVATSTSGVNAFSGYAWGENIGWISFSGTSPDYGVTTTWNHPAASAPVTIVTVSCSYEYSDWGDCIASEQIRTVTPEAGSCSGQTLLPLTQACTMPVIATTTATTTVATSTNIFVSISPATSTIFTGETLQLNATVTGTTTNNIVTWSIFPIENIIDNFYGTINDTGLYTAPTQAVNVTIQAKALADLTKTATSQIIVRLAATTTPCTAHTYSPWSICNNSLQTRTVLTNIPTDCIGGFYPLLLPMLALWLPQQQLPQLLQQPPLTQIL